MSFAASGCFEDGGSDKTSASDETSAGSTDGTDTMTATDTMGGTDTTPGTGTSVGTTTSTGTDSTVGTDSTPTSSSTDSVGTDGGTDTDPTSTGGPVCGDGQIEGDEECDDGNNDNGDACLDTCQAASCGDGHVHSGMEACDDGNNTGSDGCENNCTISLGVKEVASFWYNTCALFHSGAVRCWGFGYAGANGTLSTLNLGDDETAGAFGDIDVGGKVVQVAPGANFVCARLENGAVRCWGHNGLAQLGLGHTDNIGDDEAPSAAGSLNLGGTAIALDAGRNHACVVLSGGAVRCWGEGNLGQLGYGNTATIGDNETPASAGDVNVGGAAVAVGCGWSHTCALLATGKVRCWGLGTSGRLGYGNTTTIGDDETPATAGDVDVGGTVVQLAVGEAHNCALLDTGKVRCWGVGAAGVLGYGNISAIGDDETPASAGDVSTGAGTVVSIALGQDHSCAILDGGKVRCWGSGSGGRLGQGNLNHIGDDELPSTVGVVNVGADVTSIAGGDQHTCVRTTASAVRCWGASTYGQLGYGNTNTIGDDEAPASAGNVPLF